MSHKLLEHRFLQLCLRQKFLEPGVLVLQLSQPSGLLGLHSPVLLSPAVVRRLHHLQDPADVGDGLALSDQLLGGFELADGLLRCVPGAFHGRDPAQSGRMRTVIHPGPVFRLHLSTADIGNALALDEKLLSRVQLAVDLPGCVALRFKRLLIYCQSWSHGRLS